MDADGGKHAAQLLGYDASEMASLYLASSASTVGFSVHCMVVQVPTNSVVMCALLKL